MCKNQLENRLNKKTMEECTNFIKDQKGIKASQNFQTTSIKI